MGFVDHAALYQQFSRSPWLVHIGAAEPQARTLGDRDAMIASIDRDPEAFYGPPYERPYEDWCGVDHRQAAALAPGVDPLVRELSRQAYLQAWESCPDAEICGLLADDVVTIATLLRHGQPLAAFTIERMQWYIKGRMPWGYHGIFPDGEWLVL